MTEGVFVPEIEPNSLPEALCFHYIYLFRLFFFCLGGNVLKVDLYNHALHSTSSIPLG